jgi:hypothetical protein
VRRERLTAEQPAGEVGEADFRRGQNFVINRYGGCMLDLLRTYAL